MNGSPWDGSRPPPASERSHIVGPRGCPGHDVRTRGCSWCEDEAELAAFEAQEEKRSIGCQVEQLKTELKSERLTPGGEARERRVAELERAVIEWRAHGLQFRASKREPNRCLNCEDMRHEHYSSGAEGCGLYCSKYDVPQPAALASPPEPVAPSAPPLCAACEPTRPMVRVSGRWECLVHNGGRVAPSVREILVGSTWRYRSDLQEYEVTAATDGVYAPIRFGADWFCDRTFVLEKFDHVSDPPGSEKP